MVTEDWKICEHCEWHRTDVCQGDGASACEGWEPSHWWNNHGRYTWHYRTKPSVLSWELDSLAKAVATVERLDAILDLDGEDD